VESGRFGVVERRRWKRIWVRRGRSAGEVVRRAIVVGLVWWVWLWLWGSLCVLVDGVGM
jgi:hypothetical protein